MSDREISKSSKTVSKVIKHYLNCPMGSANSTTKQAAQDERSSASSSSIASPSAKQQTTTNTTNQEQTSQSSSSNNNNVTVRRSGSLSTSSSLKESLQAPDESVDLTASAIDTASQLRSTLAIGQLIASSRPSAGSRLIASELKNLSRTIQEESVSLRKEVTGLAASFKAVLEDDREQRSISSAASVGRRSSLPFRRFPVFRRRQFVSRKTIPPPFPPGFLPHNNNSSSNNSDTHNNSPNLSIISSSKTASIKSSSNLSSNQLPIAQKQSNSNGLSANTNETPGNVLKTAAKNTMNDLTSVLKNLSPWLPRSSNDGESNTDSTDTTPGSSPP